MQQEIYQWGHAQHPTLVFFHGLGSTGLAFGELGWQDYATAYFISMMAVMYGF